MTINKRFFNSKGYAYASLTADGRLIKNEKEQDRLHILGNRGYAVDVALVDEALRAGATVLEIQEKTLAGGQRIYRVPLSDLLKYASIKTLGGVTRYAFSLAIYTLVSGIPEEWQIAEHGRWLASQSEAPTAREEQPQQQQASLFDQIELQDLALSGKSAR
jgi:hypothetical protein